MKGIKKTVAKKAASPIAHGVGRRKSAVARVWLRDGSGNLTVNGREYKAYFGTEDACMSAVAPVRVVPDAVHYDVEANVVGGGLFAQADAVGLGFARALAHADENWRVLLRHEGLLTVDARNKERKKYGRKAARRRFQFVKR